MEKPHIDIEKLRGMLWGKHQLLKGHREVSRGDGRNERFEHPAEINGGLPGQLAGQNIHRHHHRAFALVAVGRVTREGVVDKDRLIDLSAAYGALDI